MATKTASHLASRIASLQDELTRIKVLARRQGLRQSTPPVNLGPWRKAAGILNNRAIPDPVRWQRRIRREWERLPTS